MIRYYSLLQENYSSINLFYSVLLQALNYKELFQYYPVLQRITPELTVVQSMTPNTPCTTKYFFYTKIFYLRFRSSKTFFTSPVPPCTKMYYSNTTLILLLMTPYKVLL